MSVHVVKEKSKLGIQAIRRHMKLDPIQGQTPHDGEVNLWLKIATMKILKRIVLLRMAERC